MCCTINSPHMIITKTYKIEQNNSYQLNCKKTIYTTTVYMIKRIGS